MHTSALAVERAFQKESKVKGERDVAQGEQNFVKLIRIEKNIYSKLNKNFLYSLEKKSMTSF